MPELQYKKLGEFLVEQGIVTKRQLDDALEKQKTSMQNKRLGEVLVKMGYITSRRLSQGLAKLLNIPSVKLGEMEIPQSVIESVPKDIAQIYRVIPIRRRGNVLQVATADPSDVTKMDNLERLLDCTIEPVLTSSDDIREALRKYYQATENTVQSMLSTMSGASTLSTLSSLSSMSSMSSLSSISVDSIDSVELDDSIRGAEGKTKQDADEGDLDDAPIVKFVHTLILEAFRQGASDIHIEPAKDDLKIRYRVDGVLHHQPAPPKKYQKSIISRLKIMSGMDISEKRIPQDGRIKIKLMGKTVDLRVSALPAVYGESVVMRILDKSGLFLGLEQLGFSPRELKVWEELLITGRGIIYITGPTGSGKTTTLYASLHKINKPTVKILTVEDPVEYQLSGINQIQVHADIGLTFAHSLRSMLRQDPDIVLVGETRDVETAEIAIRAALTGHLVFSTLHTNDSASTVTRLLDMGIQPFLLSASVRAIMAQRLVRTICSTCKETYKATPEEVRELRAYIQNLPDGLELHRGRGCPNCQNTGYQGRMGIYELMDLDEELREMVLHREPSQVLKGHAIEKGMSTLRGDGCLKVVNGMTTLAEVYRVTQEDTQLVELAESISETM